MKVVFFGYNSVYSVQHLEVLAVNHDVIGIVEAIPKGYVPPSPAKQQFDDWRKKPRLGLLAERLQIPRFLLQTAAANADTEARGAGLLQFLQKLAPDVCCVAGLPRRVLPAWMEIPRLGFINSHPSLLPQYRGPTPWFWQFLQMDCEGGVTVHEMSKEFDTGAILDQTTLSIKLGLDGQVYLKQTAEAGALLLSQVLTDLARGKRQSRQQEERAGLIHAPYPDASRDYIDWDNWSVERIFHASRGVYPWFNPFPKASGFLEAFTLMAEGYDLETGGGVPGTIGFHKGRIWRFLRHGRIQLRPQLSVSRTRAYIRGRGQ